MQTNVLLAGFVAVTTASGLIAPGHIGHKQHLAARQTASSDSKTTGCIDALAGAYSSFPTPPPEILSYAEAHPLTETDPCSYSIPPLLSSMVISYETEVMSWYSSESSAIDSAFSACPEYYSVASGYLDICTSDMMASGGIGAVTSMTDTASTSAVMDMSGMSMGTMTSDSSASMSMSSSVSQAAGPRETGMIGAALAAMGLAGAVAAF